MAQENRNQSQVNGCCNQSSGSGPSPGQGNCNQPPSPGQTQGGCNRPLTGSGCNQPPQQNCIQSKETESNKVVTVINHAQISNDDGGLIKYVDKNFASVGDELTYTIGLKNTGNTNANNIFLTDTIPNGTTFIDNSVEINGISFPGANPQSGFGVGILAPNALTTVTFRVLVNTIPDPNPIPNNAIINYTYTSNPSSPNAQTATEITNTVFTSVNVATVENNKLVDKEFANIGDILTYTINLKNTGTTTAQNVLFTDTIPQFTEFVANSVIVDGITQVGANPQIGILLNSIAPNQEKTVAFKVEVTTIPDDERIENTGSIAFNYIIDPSIPIMNNVKVNTNTVFTNINSVIINPPVKTSTPYYVDVNDTITYNIKFINEGNVNANNVVLTDSIPNGTSFIPNSVIVNGVNLPGANPQNGINLQSLASNQSIDLEFKVLVDTIPQINPIPNTAYLNFSYLVNPNDPSNPINEQLQSNTVYNEVRHGGFENGGLLKTVDKEFVSLGEELTYNLNLTNTGNTQTFDVIVTDTIPNGITIVPGSIIVNGSPQTTADLESGINLGPINPGANANILFRATVDTIPVPNPILNNFIVNYKYTLDPSVPTIISNSDISNTVSTSLNDAIIGNGDESFPKSVDKEFADVGEILTYTVTLANKGTVPGNNVVLTDTIPEGTTFVPNSVRINGIALQGANPEDGVLIGSINPGQTVLFTFQVTVDTVPQINPIPNQATINYTFTKDPERPDGVEVNGTSNIVYTDVREGNISDGSVIKSASTEFARRGDIITYTFEIPNTGNASVNNVVLTDMLEPSVSIVEGSVVVNGTNRPMESPLTGIDIGTISPNATSIVSFDVEVIELPPDGILTNTGDITYEYTVNPNEPPVQKETTSNEVEVIVRDAQIDNIDGGLIKVVDKEYAQLNDILTYTITVLNTGNVEAFNILLTDTIPNGTQFIPESVVVDGVSQPSDNPQMGIFIPTLQPNDPVIIRFKVEVTSIPDDNRVENIANVSYEFILDPDNPPILENGTSNEVVTNINSVDFRNDNFRKSSSPEYVAIGDIVTYSFTIVNEGNISAENVIFIDTLPEGVEFVEGSFVVNATTLPSANPEAGVNISRILPQSTTTITFNAEVVEVPTINPMPDSASINYTSRVNPNTLPMPGSSISNTVFNQVNSTDIEIEKLSDTSSYVVDDTVTYTVKVSNYGNIPATDFVLTDPLSPEIQFVPGSVVIDGIESPTGSVVNGISLGTIGVNQSITVTFKAKILQRPGNGIITNQSLGNYLFVVDPSLPPRQGSSSSNINEVRVEIAKLDVSKVADKKEAVLNDIITYTLTIRNTGTVAATNIIVRDFLEDGLEFVPNTFKVNGIIINGIDMNAGFNVGSLAPGQTTTIQYQAQIVKVCCDCSITNSATVTFTFRSSSTGAVKQRTEGPISVTVKTASPTFKQFDLDGLLIIPCPKPNIEEINDIKVEVEIMKYKVIKTIKGISAENRTLTGYKLVINGILRQVVDYTANDVCQSNHSAQFERKFSTFIVLPEDIDPSSNIELNTVVEDVYFNQINDREILTNVTLLLNANIIC